jgi:hypothetical protein
MRTKDKMIRIAGRNVFCSTIPQNATDKLVLIFFMIRLFWKLEKFPTQLCDKMETAGFLYDRLGHGKSDSLDTQWSKATLKRKPIF